MLSGRTSKEILRLGILALAAAWLLHPFATARMYGAGDALWYANMLADFVIQLRHGVFPIFAGQTEFAFNGAVYPMRVAPMYQHLAGFIDLITGRSLGFIALQHLTVIVCGVAGIYACYFTLCRIAPERRWSAAGFAILYLSCPGLLGTIYTQDLYMTWMTVPFAPLAVYGIVRTFRKDDFKSQFWLAVPLAALWWAHSPIALWFTIIASGSQVVRLSRVRDSPDPFKRALLGMLIFAVLAQYPFVSVAEISTPGTESTVVGSLTHPEKISEIVRSVFPAVVQPLSAHARELSDLQLGYSFWGILIFSAVALFSVRRLELAVLLAASAFLLILVLPEPGLNRFLWTHMPAKIVRITYYWPMQRFYLILAAILAAAGQIAFDSPGKRTTVSAAAAAVLIIGCGWNLWESRQFVRAAADRTATEAATARIQRPENLILMDHAYGLFPKMPAHFSNGVVDPRSEARLYSVLTGRLLPEPEGRTVLSGPLVGSVDANVGVLDLNPSIHLESGRRYELEFAFARKNVPGTLQFTGRSMFREYSLPSSGEPLAFGNQPNNPRTIDLWTSRLDGDDVKIRFIPKMESVNVTDLANFGSFTLREVNAGRESVTIVSLLPFRANVRSEAPALLETPRVFMSGYLASVDGHNVEVLRSTEGLVSVSVEPGDHAVSLWFVGPLLLRFSYWAAICAWAAPLFIAILAARRPKN
jgi:hypothetical protein